MVQKALSASNSKILTSAFKGISTKAIPSNRRNCFEVPVPPMIPNFLASQKLLLHLLLHGCWRKFLFSKLRRNQRRGPWGESCSIFHLPFLVSNSQLFASAMGHLEGAVRGLQRRYSCGPDVPSLALPASFSPRMHRPVDCCQGRFIECCQRWELRSAKTFQKSMSTTTGRVTST